MLKALLRADRKILLNVVSVHPCFLYEPASLLETEVALRYLSVSNCVKYYYPRVERFFICSLTLTYVPQHFKNFKDFSFHSEYRFANVYFLNSIFRTIYWPGKNFIIWDFYKFQVPSITFVIYNCIFENKYLFFVAQYDVHNAERSAQCQINLSIALSRFSDIKHFLIKNTLSHENLQNIK